MTNSGQLNRTKSVLERRFLDEDPFREPPGFKPLTDAQWEKVSKVLWSKPDPRSADVKRIVDDAIRGYFIIHWLRSQRQKAADVRKTIKGIRAKAAELAALLTSLNDQAAMLISTEAGKDKLGPNDTPFNESPIVDVGKQRLRQAGEMSELVAKWSGLALSAVRRAPTNSPDGSLAVLCRSLFAVHKAFGESETLFTLKQGSCAAFIHVICEVTGINATPDKIVHSLRRLKARINKEGASK